MPPGPSHPLPNPRLRRRLSFRLQALALILALVVPFGLYRALENGQPALASVLFAILVLSLGITLWAG